MTKIDFVVLAVYLSSVLLTGIFVSRKREQNFSEFFTTNRSMNWFTIGLSVMVTAFSAVNYTGFSGEVFSHGLYVFLCLPVFILVALPVNKIIIPYFYNQKYTTAYEYLEKKFDKKVKHLAAFLFIVWRVFWSATILYIPTNILSLITGWNLYGIIMVVGFSVLIYTTYGGIRAVMITDTIQFFVLFIGLIIGIITVANKFDGGLPGIISLAVDNGLAKPFVPFDPQLFSFDPSIRITFWSCTIGTFVAFLARYSSDQMVVQRYFTAKTLKDATRGFTLNVVSIIVSLFILALLGYVIFSHAYLNDTLGKFNKPLVYFVKFVRSLPTGVSGIIIAGLIAATMSSIDSGANSCTQVWIADFLELRGKREIDLKESRIFSIIFGLLIIFLSLFVGKLGSIFEVANKIINGFGSPLLALFILGIYSKKTSSRGVFIGGICGAIISVFISLFIKNLALHYYAVVNLGVTLTLCFIFSKIDKVSNNIINRR